MTRLRWKVWLTPLFPPNLATNSGRPSTYKGHTGQTLPKCSFCIRRECKVVEIVLLDLAEQSLLRVTCDIDGRDITVEG